MDTFQFWPELPYWSFQVTRFISQIEAGGANFEEMYRTCRSITPGDPESFFRQWQRVGEEVEQKAQEAASSTNSLSARAGFQRAATYYLMSQVILSADDPRKLSALEQVYQAFRNATTHMHPAPEIASIRYSDVDLETFYFRPQDDDELTPAIVFINGGEMTASEAYNLYGWAAVRAGYGFMCFDQPGNALSLLRNGLTATPDSDRFISPAIDYLFQRDDIDRSRMILLGSGLYGGLLAPRAAVADKRVKAVISACMPLSFAASLEKTYPHRSADYKNFVTRMLGATSPSLDDIKKAAEPYGLDGVLERLECPILMLQGSDDEQVVNPEETARIALDRTASIQKKLVIIESNDLGGSLHCQLDNLHMAYDEIFTWLADIQFA